MCGQCKESGQHARELFEDADDYPKSLGQTDYAPADSNTPCDPNEPCDEIAWCKEHV